MNPLRNIFIILSVCIPFYSHAQIHLKGHYTCKFYEDQSPNTMAEMCSKTDTFLFVLYSRDIGMGEEVEDSVTDLKKGLQMCFGKRHYFKTKDNLYIYTGKFYDSTTYIYEIYVPTKQASVSVRSRNNDSLFSERSKWLLSQVRAHKNTDVFLLNEKGQSCQDPYNP